MSKINKIAENLRKSADELDRVALSHEINRNVIGPDELVELIKQKVNSGDAPGLLQEISDLLFDRYEVSRVRQLTDAQSTELATIIGIGASTPKEGNKKNEQ